MIESQAGCSRDNDLQEGTQVATINLNLQRIVSAEEWGLIYEVRIIVSSANCHDARRIYLDTFIGLEDFVARQLLFK
jgi:hypothetical protein